MKKAFIYFPGLIGIGDWLIELEEPRYLHNCIYDLIDMGTNGEQWYMKDMYKERYGYDLWNEEPECKVCKVRMPEGLQMLALLQKLSL